MLSQKLNKCTQEGSSSYVVYGVGDIINTFKNALCHITTKNIEILDLNQQSSQEIIAYFNKKITSCETLASEKKSFSNDEMQEEIFSVESVFDSTRDRPQKNPLIIFPLETLSDLPQENLDSIITYLNKIKFISAIQNIEIFRQASFVLNYDFITFELFNFAESNLNPSEKIPNSKRSLPNASFESDPKILFGILRCFPPRSLKILNFLIEKLEKKELDDQSSRTNFKFSMIEVLKDLKGKMIVGSSEELIHSLKEMRDQGILVLGDKFNWIKFANQNNEFIAVIREIVNNFVSKNRV